jgi:integrase
MEWLGHSQIGLTMNTYAHVLPAAKEDAAAKIQSLLA